MFLALMMSHILSSIKTNKYTMNEREILGSLLQQSFSSYISLQWIYLRSYARISRALAIGNGGSHQKDEALLVASKQLTTILSTVARKGIANYRQKKKGRGKGTTDQFLQA